jgi:hypothetical protein
MAFGREGVEMTGAEMEERYGEPRYRPRKTCRFGHRWIEERLPVPDPRWTSGVGYDTVQGCDNEDCPEAARKKT